MEFTKRRFLKSMLAAPALAPALAAPALLVSQSSTASAASHAEKKSNTSPGFYRYHVGDIEITALLDGYFGIPNGFITSYDEKTARASTKDAYRRFTEKSVQIPVNGYVIKTGKETILLDAGAPTLISPTLGGLKANLAAAGFSPKDISTVILTHAHPDHIGALTKKDGSKTFENAKFICSQIEWDFIHNDKIRNSLPKDFQGMVDLARFKMKPYGDQRQLFSGEKELFTGITSVPLPGHTPGHTGFAIHSNNESLLIWGDVIHLSTLQFSNPDWGVVFDADPELAKKTRRKMLDRASADKMAVAGMHIDFPGIGYVERRNKSYRYVSAPWMPH